MIGEGDWANRLLLFLGVSEGSSNLFFACADLRTSATDLLGFLSFEIANSNPNFDPTRAHTGFSAFPKELAEKVANPPTALGGSFRSFLLSLYSIMSS